MTIEVDDTRRRRAVLRRNGARVRVGLLRLVAGYRSDGAARTVVLGLIAVDLLFVGLYLFKYVFFYFELDSAVSWPRSLDIDYDKGYPELFNYCKTALCVALLLGVFFKRGHFMYAAWALVFLFVLADDALSLHERGGSRLATAFDLVALPGLRPEDTGELLTWCAAAAVLIAVLARAFRNATPEAIGFGGVFAAIFAVLVGFGAGIDMIHVALRGAPLVPDRLLAVAEDGGEMLVITLACATALLLYRRRIVPGTDSSRRGRPCFGGDPRSGKRPWPDALSGVLTAGDGRGLRRGTR